MALPAHSNIATLLALAALDPSDFDAALESILKVAANALDSERVGFWTLRRQPPSIFCELIYRRSEGLYARGERILARNFPGYFEALKEAQVIDASDAQSDPRTRELSETYLRPSGITSMMDVPVWARGDLAGVLCHEHVGAPRRWSPDDQKFAISVGQVIARALEARHTRRAEASAWRAGLMSEVTEAMAGILDPEELPSVLVQLLVPRLADSCAIHVKESGRLRRLAALHVDAERNRILAQMTTSLAETLRGRIVDDVAREGRSILLPSVGEEELARYWDEEGQRRLVRRLRMRSLVIVPMTLHGRVLGTLTLASAGRVHCSDDLLLAERLGACAAKYIENARLYRDLDRTVRLRDEFLSIASHELSTPLTSLRLAVEALSRGLLAVEPATVVRASELVQRQVQRLSRIVQELLDVSRVDHAQLPLARERVDLGEAARSVARAFDEEAKRAGCTLDVHADAPVVGSWDPSRLEQVIVNLVSNAIKFGPGHAIEITVERGERARLTVQDHGIGIPSDALPHVFDRFRRAVSSKEFGGFGLGLYVARGIVAAHGGTISVESTPGDGATFCVELPYDVEREQPVPRVA